MARQSFTQNESVEWNPAAVGSGLQVRWVGISKLDEKCDKQGIGTALARCDAGQRI